MVPKAQQQIYKFIGNKDHHPTWDYKVLHSEPCSIKNPKKLCLFAHYSRSEQDDSTLVEYLRELKECGIPVALCTTNGNLTPDLMNSIKSVTCMVIQRNNVGFDFGSWATLHKEFKKLKEDYLLNLDQLLLANNSVIGPLYPLKPIFEKTELIDADFWGMTASWQIQWHLQSYFLSFNKKVLESSFLLTFLDNIKLYKSKQRVIHEYELGLSQALVKAGFQGRVAFSTDQIETSHPERVPLFSNPNPTLCFWDLLIEDLHFPFLKKQVPRENPLGNFTFSDLKSLFPEENTSQENFLNQIGSLQPMVPLPPRTSTAKS